MSFSSLERETGIEPASLAWKARVLPLNYSRMERFAIIQSTHSENLALACAFADHQTANLLMQACLVEGTGFEPVYA